MSKNLSRGQMLALIRDGRMTPDAFFKKTRSHWAGAAAYLMRRWRAPSWLEIDELIQELMLGAWLAIWRYEEGRGKTIQEFVDWNAIDFAKKKFHKARGAGLHGSPDRRLSRFEIPFTCFESDDGDGVENMIAPTNSVAAETIDAHRAMVRVEQTCTGEAEKTIARLLAQNSDAVEVTEAVCHNTELRGDLSVMAVARLVVDVQTRLEGVSR